MRLIHWSGFLAGLVFPFISYGQSLVGAGYVDPGAIQVAPGQVLTLFTTGLSTMLSSGRTAAQTVPLPSSLAGVSVSLHQTYPETRRSLPLFTITQFNHCGATDAPSPACVLTGITVQIPFDISVPNPLIFIAPISQGSSEIRINENGNEGPSFSVVPVATQVHVLRSCDINGSTFGSNVCYPLVTHLDGSPVLQAPRTPSGAALTLSEANPGEVLVLYAYGMGQVTAETPAAVTGATMQYDYRANVAPSMPLNGTPPLFAGLTPGQIGLYQVNFVVPQPPAGSAPCGTEVQSNLTVSVAVGDTYDGAAICVNTGAAPAP